MLIEAGWLLEELTCMYINTINHQVNASRLICWYLLNICILSFKHVQAGV